MVNLAGVSATQLADPDRLQDQQGGQILGRAVKISYDTEVDILRVIFRDVPIAESDEDKPGVIIDYDAEGNVVGLEILDASRRVDDPRQVEYAGA